MPDSLHRPMMRIKQMLKFIGNLGLFTVRALRPAVVPPFEGTSLGIQLEEVGWKSLPIVIPAGFALGVVLTLHTCSTLIRFGAQSMIPSVQSLSFFNKLGPLVTNSLKAGRVGAGIGSVFGFIICLVSCYFGYTTDEGADGVGRAATNRVVLSSLLITLSDVVLVKLIFFLFPDTAI